MRLFTSLVSQEGHRGEFEHFFLVPPSMTSRGSLETGHGECIRTTEVGEHEKSGLDLLLCWFYSPKNVMAKMLTVPIKLKTMPVVSKARTLGVAQKMEEMLLQDVSCYPIQPASCSCQWWRRPDIHLHCFLSLDSLTRAEIAPSARVGTALVSDFLLSRLDSRQECAVHFCAVEAQWQSQLLMRRGVWQKIINVLWELIGDMEFIIKSIFSKVRILFVNLKILCNTFFIPVNFTHTHTHTHTFPWRAIVGHLPARHC